MTFFFWGLNMIIKIINPKDARTRKTKEDPGLSPEEHHNTLNKSVRNI